MEDLDFTDTAEFEAVQSGIHPASISLRGLAHNQLIDWSRQANIMWAETGDESQLHIADACLDEAARRRYSRRR